MPLPEIKGRNQNSTYYQKTFRATITEEKLMEAYARLGQWRHVAKELKVSHAYIIRARKELGIFRKTLTRGKQYGGLNSRHTKNSGKNKCNRGYIVVGRYHPENDHEYTVYEHTLVMEKFLGRHLLPGEIIHHIDGNKANNSIENLYLCSHVTHRYAEASAIKLLQELYKRKVVGFNKEKGVYYICGEENV